jgi:DNA-3-methyladenine glycosylase II
VAKAAEQTFELYPRAPFRLDLTVWALRRSPDNRIDRWDGCVYRRLVMQGDLRIEWAVRQTGPPESPELQVGISSYGAGSPDAAAVGSTLTRLLGLQIDLGEFYHRVAVATPLAEMVQRFSGLKPPRLPTVFETVVNGIACQQLSLNVGIGLLNRLSREFGPAAGGQHAFPRPADLCGAGVEALRELGFSRRKAEYIFEAARAVGAGSLDLEALERSGDREAVEDLQRLRGIGRWTAEYVMLRGLGRLDFIPADDVGAQNKIQRWLGLEARPDYAAVHRSIDRWSPYRGMIYFYLLLDHLSQKGVL